MTSDGLGAKTRQLDVSTTASVEIESLRASWATMINNALETEQVLTRVDHRSFERQGKAMEPTVKMGFIITAIERRALRDHRSISMPSPVTTRGQLNAEIKEIRAVQLYIDLGCTFIEAETGKLIAAARSLSSATKRLASLAALQRAASAIRREGPNRDQRERARISGRGR